VCDREKEREKRRNTMKRFTTIVFAALVAVTLSMPVWAQNQAPSANNQTKTAQSKGEKKQANKAKKQEKKAKKQANKDTKKNSTNTSTK
jgi:Small metal-binding protein